MRRKILIIIATLSFVPMAYSATTINFYSDGIFGDGNTYDYVNVWNNAKVNIAGGSIERLLSIYNSGTVNISNGDISHLFSYGQSAINITGGICGSIDITENSQCNITGGTLYDSISIANNASVYLHYLDTPINMMRPYGIGYLEMLGYSSLHIYGYDFEYVTPPGYSMHYLTGHLENSVEFILYLRHLESNTQIILHETPEPTTLFLFALGAALLRKRDLPPFIVPLCIGVSGVK